jgi:hypothetical protein
MIKNRAYDKNLYANGFDTVFIPGDNGGGEEGD